jgi:hypothetical protein
VQRLVTVPNRQVDRDQIVAEKLPAAEMTETTWMPPDKARYGIREPIDLRQDSQKALHLG